MDIDARKSNLISIIQNLSDNSLFEKIESLLSVKHDWASELSEEEKKMIWEGKEQARKGEVVSSEEVWRSFKDKFENKL